MGQMSLSNQASRATRIPISGQRGAALAQAGTITPGSELTVIVSPGRKWTTGRRPDALRTPSERSHGYLQIGRGRPGDGGLSALYWAMTGSSSSFGQNFGVPISLRQAAFQ